MNNYSSYLVRHWLIADPRLNRLEENNSSQVFDIEHVQSGRRTRVGQLSDAAAWMESITTEKAATTDQNPQLSETTEKAETAKLHMR